MCGILLHFLKGHRKLLLYQRKWMIKRETVFERIKWMIYDTGIVFYFFINWNFRSNLPKTTNPSIKKRNRHRYFRIKCWLISDSSLKPKDYRLITEFRVNFWLSWTPLSHSTNYVKAKFGETNPLLLYFSETTWSGLLRMNN